MFYFLSIFLATVLGYNPVKVGLAFLPMTVAIAIDPANLVDLQAYVRETGADIGLAFDGDADRCFVVDEKGDPVSPSAVTALVAKRELAKEPGASIDRRTN